MEHELVILGDFTVTMVPSCEMIDQNEDTPDRWEMENAAMLTDMLDEALHFGVCDHPDVANFARRLGVMVC